MKSLSFERVLDVGEGMTSSKMISDMCRSAVSNISLGVGTSYYVSPEIESNTTTKYNQKVDMYSLGCNIFYPSLFIIDC
jgi:serine/threonine protein kinase